MPKDPPSTNPKPHPVPLGQAQPAAPHLSHPQQLYPYNQQPVPVPLQQHSQQFGQRNVPDMRGAQHQHAQHQSNPQQSRPRLAQPASYFVPGFPQPMPYNTQQAQPYSGVQYQMYPNPYQYSIPQQTQQQSINPRQQRSYQPHTASTMRIPQRPPQTPYPPAQKKKILQIVDPDTYEEVKVSPLHTPPTPTPSQPPAPRPPPKVTIPERASHALELVEDPADDTPDADVEDAKPSLEPTQHQPAAIHKRASVAESLVSDTVQSEDVTPLDVIDPVPKTSSLPTPSTKPELHPEPVANIDAAVSDVSSGVTSTPLDSSSDVVVPVPDPVVAKDKYTQVDTSPVTPVNSPQGSATVEKTAKPQTSTSATPTAPIPTPVVEHVAPTPTAPVAPPKVAVEEKKPTPPVPATAPAPVKPKTVPVAAPVAAKKTQPPKVVKPEPKEQPANPVQPDEPASPVQPDEPSSPVQPDEPEPVVDKFIFEEGERRVYPASFMAELRELRNSKRISDFEKQLSGCDILKNSSSPNSGRNEQWSRSGRSNMGQMSSEPRRAFPGQGGPNFPTINIRGSAPPPMSSGGLSSYDSFEMRGPRSQPPPSTHRGSGINRDGDPRGTRQQGQGSRNRYDGPMRHHHQMMDQYNPPSAEKLKTSEHGWKRNKEADDEITAKVKTVRSLLNKLTLEKFEKIFKQIVAVGMSSYEILVGVVREIFEKTLFEPKFAGMYAELCKRLDLTLREVLQKTPVVEPSGNPIDFRKILLNNCREEFTRFAESGEVSSVVPAGKEETEQQKKKREEDEENNKAEEKMTPEELKKKHKVEKAQKEAKGVKAKRRMLANVSFIGELYLKDLLREQIIHKQCIQKLLTLGISKKEEDVLEALCKLISKTGAKLSLNVQAVQHIDKYFNPLIQLSKDHTLPARVRFMLQDLIEQRSNGWRMRREEVKAKTIAEIHKDIEDKERNKQESEARQRDKRGRGGVLHSRDRSSQNFTPRVPMTMPAPPSRQRSAGSITRSQATIEKHANRSSSGLPNNFANVRLGPKSGVAGPPLGGLRPGSASGMMKSFGAPGLNRELSANGQSGDVRRGGKAQRAPSHGRRLSSHSASPEPAQIAAQTQVTSAPKPVEVPPQKSDPGTVKRKIKNILGEYWGNSSNKDAREYVQQALTPQDYPLLVEETIRISLDAKIESIPKGIPLLVYFISEFVPGQHFERAFSSIVSAVDDLDMDNPRASEFLGRYIGAVAATRKLPKGATDTLGLDFLKGALPENCDPKRKTKLMLSIFLEMGKYLETAVPDVKKRQEVVRKASKATGIDIVSQMNGWNPMNGLSALHDMVKSNGVEFLTPLLQLEISLKKTLSGGKADAGKVLELFKSHAAVLNEELISLVVRQSLDWLFFTASESIKTSFDSVIVSPLLKCFGKSISKEVQMAAVLEMQSFMGKSLDILPPVKEGAFDQPASVAFHILHGSNLVSGKVLLQWKDDSDRSTHIDGKEKVLQQSSQFFQWLSKIEQ